jgi:outer membrane protein assembly factor BamB
MEPETDGLHCMISTPLLEGSELYGVCSYGAFRCLDATTGKRLWETYEPTGNGRWWNAFLIPNGDRTFIANEQGELIIARLSREGYREVSRTKLIAPTNRAQGRDVVWSHPAFANRHIFARNDREILCASLAAE